MGLISEKEFNYAIKGYNISEENIYHIKRLLGLVTYKRKPIKRYRKNEAYSRSNGICERVGCENKITFNQTEFHHIKPVCSGGTNEINNIAVICPHCHDEISRYQRFYQEKGADLLRKFLVTLNKPNPPVTWEQICDWFDNSSHPFYTKYNFKNRI